MKYSCFLSPASCMNMEFSFLVINFMIMKFSFTVLESSFITSCSIFTPYCCVYDAGLLGGGLNSWWKKNRFVKILCIFNRIITCTLCCCTRLSKFCYQNPEVLKMILSCSKLYNCLINIFLSKGVCKVEIFTVDYSRTCRCLHVRLFVVGELIDCWLFQLQHMNTTSLHYTNMDIT